jgi:hypothetical protein
MLPNPIGKQGAIGHLSPENCLCFFSAIAIPFANSMLLFEAVVEFLRFLASSCFSKGSVREKGRARDTDDSPYQ